MRRKGASFLLVGLLMAAALVLTRGSAGLIHRGSSGRPASPRAGHAATSVAEPLRAKLIENYGKLPMSFEPCVEANCGNSDGEAKFLSRGQGYTLFLTPAEAVLALRKSEPRAPASGGLNPSRDREGEGRVRDSRHGIRGSVFPNRESRFPSPDSSPLAIPEAGVPSIPEAEGPPTVLRMKLAGANPEPRITGLDPLPGKSNYFLGNDPSKWRTNVPTYAKVKYESIYPGIDLVYYGNQRQLEYDFVVAPGARPETIRLDFDGAEKVETSAEGDLVVHMGGEEARFHQPVVYQELDSRRHIIEGRFALRSQDQAGFEIASYDPTKPLIIDPTLGLSYSTYLNGSDRGSGSGIAVDSSGNAFVTGGTNSPNFPTTPGAFQTKSVGGVFVVKLNPAVSGSGGLVYSTYLGGSGAGTSIAVDSFGNAYVTGYTYSADFPITSGALQTVFPGKPPTSGSGGQPSSPGVPSAIVTVLNAAGNGLIYSTYLGGSGGVNKGNGIAVDSLGNVYVTGMTSSGNFPVTPGAFQPKLLAAECNPCNAFVSKLNPKASGSASLVYSTYLGGTGARAAGATYGDSGNGIAVDFSGNIYVTGQAFSGNFPTTPNAFQTIGFGFPNAFVAKLNPAASGSTSLVYSTYLSGSSSGTNFQGLDSGNGVVVDLEGNVYVVGTTSSPNFPTTPGAFQPNFNGVILRDHYNAFVAKLNPFVSGNDSLVYSTYLGGINAGSYGGVYRGELGLGIAVDSSGKAYVTGTATSDDFPITPDAFQTLLGTRGGNAFVAILDTATSGTASLVYSTYLGGTGFVQPRFGRLFGDIGTAIAVDPLGNVYVTGYTESRNNDFPTFTAVRPIQAALSGLTDPFIAKIGGGPNNPVPTLSSLSTSSTPAGSPGLGLTVTGTNFVVGARVQWNGADRPTTILGYTQLRASIGASDLATPGTVQITVLNPLPGGGTSNSFVFTITPPNPVPILTSISPASTTAGGGAFTLTVTGTNFVNGAVVMWNGLGRPTTFLSETRLTAAIVASDIAREGTAQVTVLNPAPGGGVSNALSFAIVNPVSVISSLSPANAAAGGTGFAMSVTGTGFVPTSVVQWNGSNRLTAYFNSTRLTATVTANDIAAGGTAQVTVFNPSPGGGVSNALPFTINPAAPVVSAGGLVNAASFSTRPPAAGSIVALFGSGLASATTAADVLPLPTTLGSTSVRVNGLAAPLYSVSPLQVNFQLPWELQGQSQASVTVTVGDATSSPINVNLAAYTPAIFATNQQGTGQGAILVANTASIAAPASAFPGSRPARRGEAISIYATGLGLVVNPPATGAAAAGSPASTTTTLPTVTVGGVAAQVTFSGLAPGYTGLYQVNAQAPANAPIGDAVPVSLSIGGVSSNTVTIAVQ